VIFSTEKCLLIDKLNKLERKQSHKIIYTLNKHKAEVNAVNIAKTTNSSRSITTSISTSFSKRMCFSCQANFDTCGDKNMNRCDFTKKSRKTFKKVVWVRYATAL
jgi:hypothetical protein